MGIKMINYRTLIKLIGVSVGTGLSILMYIIFLFAYFVGDYNVVVAINNYNEANIELITLLVLSPIITMGLYYTIKDLMGEHNG